MFIAVLTSFLSFRVVVVRSASLWSIKTLAGYRRILNTLESDPDGRPYYLCMVSIY